MEEKLKKIISNYSDIDVSSITENTVILRDLGFNSIAVIEMISDVESEFDIEIPDEELSEIKTVGDLITYLKSIEID